MYATRTRAFRANPAGYPLAEPRAYRVNGLGCECRRPVARVAPDQLRTMSGPAGLRRAYRRGRLGAFSMDGVEYSDGGTTSSWDLIDTIPYIPPPIFTSTSPSVDPSYQIPTIPYVAGPSFNNTAQTIASIGSSVANLFGSIFGRSASGAAARTSPQAAQQANAAVAQSALNAATAAPVSSAVLYGGLGLVAFALISGRKR